MSRPDGEDPDQVARAVLDLLRDPDDLQRRGARPRATFLDALAPENLLYRCDRCGREDISGRKAYDHHRESCPVR